MTTVGDSSLLRDTTLSEEKEEEEEEEFDDEREVESVMNWDFNDFAITDHRLQLYCDLSLFRFLWSNIFLLNFCLGKVKLCCSLSELTLESSLPPRYFGLASVSSPTNESTCSGLQIKLLQISQLINFPFIESSRQRLKSLLSGWRLKLF